ncbi:MAG TPA: hypothetical protein PKG60_03315 [Spirochaetota bacterium]|nr:hypothetical protein [Spirochaetota bacterium]
MKKYLIALVTFLALVSPLSAEMITNGKVLSWTTSAGQNGSLKIVAVNGQYFEADQTNEKNKAAGVVKLYGATLDSGKKIVLINTGQWKEVWEGTNSGNVINGNLIAGSAKYTFKITEPVVAAVAAVKMEAGEYQGVHRHWTDKVIINADGTYKRASNNDPGTYTFDGKTLVLKWAKWDAETLVQTSPGVFTCAAYQFTLTKSTVSTVAVVNPFVNGTTLTWNTSAGQNGTILVTSVNGAKFNLDQINFNNRGAGTTKLDGEVKDGKIYIYNRQWNETWVGTLANGKITGKINNSYDFTINMTAQTAVATTVSTEPFINGRTLKWNTSAGQNGTILVTSVTGAKFNLDQINFNNRGAGTTKLDGEIKDGKIYIYNRQWNETWVGVNSNGTVSGKINNSYTFTITK